MGIRKEWTDNVLELLFKEMNIGRISKDIKANLISEKIIYLQ